VQVTNPVPHTAGRLLAVSLDMVEFFTVIALHETNMTFVRFYLGCNTVKVRQFEYLLGKVMRNGECLQWLCLLQVIDG
jgi:hypothetical protein